MIWCVLMGSEAPWCTGQTSSQPQVLREATPEKARIEALEAAIRREIGDERFTYVYNLVNLSNGAAPEALVYMPGRDYCGSGGCTSFVFAKRGGDYRLITRLSPARTPLIVSSHRTNGWNDLIVFVSGGGIQPGYYAVLPFDGKKYPDNPTALPAAALRRSVKGIAYLAGAEKADSAIVVSQR
jgi:hypothetical protein